MSDGTGDGGGTPPDDRPDPFAPLPLQPLPPVTKRNPLQPAPPASEATPTGIPSGEPIPGSTSGPASMPSSPVEPASGRWSDAPAPDLMAEAAQGEPPLVPDTFGDGDSALREAVGIPPAPGQGEPDDDDDDDDDDRPEGRRSRKGMIVAVASLVVGAGIAALVLLGRVNSARYVIACEDDRVVIEQGRTFPPWGTSPLGDAAWKPVTIPPEAACHPRETDDKAELATWYGEMLVARASTLLTEREVTKVDEAEAQLTQALLVTRALATEDARVDARKEIERLLGDVAYWRASAKLRGAADSLAEAAKEFEAAAAQRPRHVSDASAWAVYVRRLVEELRAGPSGATAATFPAVPPAERPSAAPGVALPIEPGAGSGSADSAGAAAPEVPVDAGVPTGGVLL